ncbi:MAG TPA: hypothetical protein VEJ67_11475 [Candidatus Cybelea sp.]|nr:hypothetical protein [Candidatus Cybelea sp.]
MVNRKIVLFVLGFSLALLSFAGHTRADNAEQEIILPAGALIRCTLDEPNFSTKTAEVGDPVICHLGQTVLFDRPLFPRGAYLSGHLEAAKDPGHFVGKGYLQLEFDKIGFPEGQIPLPAKLISAKGYRVDREGRIIGHGHPVRDAAEWMIPPLWPEKMLMLPARGPRPTLKHEEQLVLRVMDDIALPYQPLLGWRFFTHPGGSSSSEPDGSFHQSIPANSPARSPQPSSGVRTSVGNGAVRYPYAVNIEWKVASSLSPAEQQTAVAKTAAAPLSGPARVNVLVLRDGSTSWASGLRMSSGQLSYARVDGSTAVVSLNEVDWTRTLQKNAENGLPLTLSSGSR